MCSNQKRRHGTVPPERSVLSRMHAVPYGRLYAAVTLSAPFGDFTYVRGDVTYDLTTLCVYPLDTVNGGADIKDTTGYLAVVFVPYMVDALSMSDMVFDALASVRPVTVQYLTQLWDWVE